MLWKGYDSVMANTKSKLKFPTSKTDINSVNFKLSRFIRLRSVVWYGVHECNGCGAPIVKSSSETGGVALDAPHDSCYPNHKWALHCCHGKPQPAPVK